MEFESSDIRERGKPHHRVSRFISRVPFVCDKKEEAKNASIYKAQFFDRRHMYVITLRGILVTAGRYQQKGKIHEYMEIH